MPASKRLTTLLAAASLAVAFPLAGCGGGDDSSGGGGGGTQAEQPPAEVVAQGDPANGKKVFASNCSACHGDKGQGVSGPDLRQESFKNPDVVVNQVRNGGGGMPAFKDQLSSQELSDVSAFVTKELAASK